MLEPSKVFHNIPAALRDPLVEAYSEISRNYAERRWEPSELNGGKLCEVVHTIIVGAISGLFPPAPAKPPKFVEACRAIEQMPANASLVGDRSLRILIPRLLPFLYEIRNNRGVGHVGGDVIPNHCDALAAYSCSSWLMAELVRVFHGVTISEAQAAVEVLAERKFPLVWELDGVKRVLDPRLSQADQTLILLYSANSWVPEKSLREWVENSNSTRFRQRVLAPLHKLRLIEHDSKMGRATLTTLGVKKTEDDLLRSYRI